MATSDAHSASPGSDSDETMVCLRSRDACFALALGNVFPLNLVCETIEGRMILDVGCGAGAWVLDVASSYPLATVVGIDAHQKRLASASFQVTQRGIPNASFVVMDASKSLIFPDHQFDVIHARLVSSLLLIEQWPSFLQECVRLLRPGGVLCLTEGERGSSSSPALEKLTALATFALRLGGRGPSLDGATMGFTMKLPRWLRESGYQTIQVHPSLIEYSRDTRLSEPMQALIATAWPLLNPVLLDLGLLTPLQAASLYEQIQQDLSAQDFCAVWPLVTVWGTAPSPETTMKQTASDHACLPTETKEEHVSIHPDY